MNHRIVMTAFLLTLFSAHFCFADTLVITYRSGKTQTVTLDEPSTTINSWQFVGCAAAAAPAAPAAQPQPIAQPAAQPQEALKAAPAKAAEKAPEKKSNVRFNWNAKPIPD